MLQFKDFQHAITDDREFYYSFEKNGYEICLEQCLSGFCVAIYKFGPDEKISGLVEPKRCTEFDFAGRKYHYSFGTDGLKKGEANMVRLRAMKFANIFYKKYLTLPQ